MGHDYKSLQTCSEGNLKHYLCRRLLVLYYVSNTMIYCRDISKCDLSVQKSAQILPIMVHSLYILAYSVFEWYNFIDAALF